MTVSERLLLEKLYTTQRQLDERNYAKGHSFDEWVEWWLKEDDDGCDD